MDPDIQELPTDYDMGLDFRVTKTTKGQYADYSTSKWARKETALTEVQRAAVDSFGLHNLNDFLPKRPNEVELGAIKEMFEANGVSGSDFDKHYNDPKLEKVAMKMSEEWKTKQVSMVPTLVINGKYKINMNSVGTLDDLIKLTNFLLEKK
mgnify:CR=1 FL=1